MTLRFLIQRIYVKNWKLEIHIAINNGYKSRDIECKQKTFDNNFGIQRAIHFIRIWMNRWNKTSNVEWSAKWNVYLISFCLYFFGDEWHSVALNLV